MRNETTLAAICTELQRNCGDELEACKSVGVSLLFLNQWRTDDPEVDKRVVEASRVGTQGLVSAAIKRAVHGVEKGIYYKGVRVSTEMEYSDGLLNTLLKAKVPEFAADSERAPTVNVNIANIMPRANSYDEWLAMKKQTLEKPKVAVLAPPDERDTALEALGRVMCQPGDETIEAEYVEVKPFAGIEL